MSEQLLASFPFFGGKRCVADMIWRRLGTPKQYIEPFCGSAAVLLAAPEPASLEVINDINGFIANFWRATKCQPAEVVREADYPVSHIDLGARHRWLMEQRDRIGAELQDPLWPGDARVAGWWLWGQCSWIGSGWCEWLGQIPHASNPGRGVQALGQIPHASNPGRGVQALGKIPHASNPGRGVQALGQIPHVSNPGMGVQALGKIPHVSSAGMGIQAIGQVPQVSDAGMGLLTSSGRVAWRWLHELAARLERVRIVHGSWDRCLNTQYGGEDAAVFLDPPYRAYEALYRCLGVADAVERWALENAHLRIALCGHVGDYDLPGWAVERWTRPRLTYSGGDTTDKEALWFSPACLQVTRQRQNELWEADGNDG